MLALTGVTVVTVAVLVELDAKSAVSTAGDSFIECGAEDESIGIGGAGGWRLQGEGRQSLEPCRSTVSVASVVSLFVTGSVAVALVTAPVSVSPLVGEEMMSYVTRYCTGVVVSAHG